MHKKGDIVLKVFVLKVLAPRSQHMVSDYRCSTGFK